MSQRHPASVLGGLPGSAVDGASKAAVAHLRWLARDLHLEMLRRHGHGAVPISRAAAGSELPVMILPPSPDFLTSLLLIMHMPSPSLYSHFSLA